MSKGILTVTVNPAVDVTVTSPSPGELRMRCPPHLWRGEAGSTRHLRMRCSTNFVLSAGGKGVNVARVLRVLRARVLAAGVTGGETGEFFQKLLRKENIPAAFLPVKGPTRLNVTILGSRPGGRDRVIQEGPRLTPQEVRRFEIRYRRWLRRSRLVVLAGRNAVGAPVDWYARLVRLARKEGVPAAVDTSGTALVAALKAKPFLIKPNRAEAEAILHRRLDSPARIKKALKHFHGRGVRVVLLSLGARGAVASDGKDIWYARPPLVAPGEPRPASTRSSAEAGLWRASLAAGGPPRAVNEVGCGDALLAGFCSAFDKKSLAEALRRGVACGAANALGPVPGSVHPDDVSRLEKMVTVDHWRTREQ